MRFLDTNVLIYAVSPAPNETEKQVRAEQLLGEPDLTLSVQVLQEFYSQVTNRNNPAAISHEIALRFIGSLERFPIQDITADIFLSATTISRRYQLSYWDGAILAAAKSAGCDAVYTEDLNDEQEYDGLRVINPFAGL